MFERLHIDFAKDGWRASNQRDEFPQMTQWLSRQEKIASFDSDLGKRLQPASTNSQIDNQSTTTVPPPHSKPGLSIAKSPDFPNRLISLVEELHNAPDFSHYLKLYLNMLTPRPLSSRRVEDETLPLTRVNVFKMFRFHREKIQDDNAEERDIVKAIPKSEKLLHGRFDTVVVITKPEAQSTGLEGLKILSLLFDLCSICCRYSYWQNSSYFHYSFKDNNSPGAQKYSQHLADIPTCIY